MASVATYSTQSTERGCKAVLDFCDDGNRQPEEDLGVMMCTMC